jgi:hypothetical protein
MTPEYTARHYGKPQELVWPARTEPDSNQKPISVTDILHLTVEIFAVFVIPGAGVAQSV